MGEKKAVAGGARFLQTSCELSFLPRLRYEWAMKAREFIDFWIENSVHAAEQFHGASQDVADLTARYIEAAKG